MCSVNQKGHDYVAAYLFVKHLTSIYKHPILLNYKSNIRKIAKEANISEYRLREGINRAGRLGLVRYEGSNIRLLSLKYEAKHLKSSREKYKEIKIEDLKHFFMLSVCDAENRNQGNGIRFKKQNQGKNKRTQPLGDSAAQSNENPNSYSYINDQIIFSARLVSKLFNYRSSIAGQKILDELSSKGYIKMQSNVSVLTVQQFEAYKRNPADAIHLRYDKQADQFLYVKAKSLVKIEKFWLNKDYLVKEVKDSKKVSLYTSSFFLDNF